MAELLAITGIWLTAQTAICFVLGISAAYRREALARS